MSDEQHDADRLRTVLDQPAALSVGLEEEVMLLDRETLDLAPVAAQVLARLDGDGRFKPELPAAQVELITPPSEGVAQAGQSLAGARADLEAAAAGLALPAAAGVHPFTPAEGVLNPDERYRHTREEYGPVARRQLVFGLHVHVRVNGAERALAVYNALRSYLPDLAALGANAPFIAGRDSGMASVRPKISELLPRQGVPPAFADLEELVAALEWGAAAGALRHRGMWWWELRLHPEFGTVEVRVPDQQTTVNDSEAVAALTQCLVRRLADRHDAGQPLPAHPTWRIAENRWSAARHGLDGQMADLDSGEPRPTRERLRGLVDSLAPEADALDARAALDHARELVERNGAERQREVAEHGDLSGVVRDLAERFRA